MQYETRLPQPKRPSLLSQTATSKVAKPPDHLNTPASNTRILDLRREEEPSEALKDVLPGPQNGRVFALEAQKPALKRHFSCPSEYETDRNNPAPGTSQYECDVCQNGIHVG